MTGLVERVRRRLEGVGVGSSDAVVVACSGGVDSLVLLHLLRFEGGHDRARITVAHFDHGMRPGSRANADFVAGVARAWGLDCVRGRAGEPLRSETEARRARWTFLEASAAQAGAVGVLTGHHAGDQVETVLHHLIRGSGPRGLAGMEVRRGGRIRPLLGESRDAIEAHAAHVGLRPRVDPTNAAPWTPRNRIRSEVVPLLESIRPGAAAGILHTVERISADERALAQAEERLLDTLLRHRSLDRWTLDLDPVAGLPPELAGRVLRRVVRELGGRLGRAATEAAVDFVHASGGATCRLPGGVVLRRSLGELEIEVTSDDAASPSTSGSTLTIPGPAAGAGDLRIDGEPWRVRWGEGPGPGGEGARLALPLAFPLTVRGWRAGDRLAATAADGPSVARAWMEAGIPRHRRRRLPVVEDARGRLLWVPGAADADPGATFFIGILHADAS